MDETEKTTPAVHRPAGKPPGPRGLNHRQKSFCLYYSNNYNAADSFLKAGYAHNNKRKYVFQNAYKLLSLPTVQAELKRIEDENRARHFKIIDRNIEELSRIAYATIDSTIDMSTGTPVYKRGSEASIQDIQVDKSKNVRIKHHNKLQAIDILNRMMGAYHDKIDVTTKGEALQTPVINYISTDVSTGVPNEVVNPQGVNTQEIPAAEVVNDVKNVIENKPEVSIPAVPSEQTVKDIQVVQDIQIDDLLEEDGDAGKKVH